MTEQYDLIVVGGGIAGSSLAGHVAASGARVLVLERETQFRDRVRGEWVAPWGVDEVERLGVLEVLRDDANAHDVPYHHIGISRLAREASNLVEHSKSKRAAITFFHPAAQEALFNWASEQGAEAIRGARVTSVSGGETPEVEWAGAEPGTASARLVVGADGRTSMVRAALGREEHTRGEHRLWAGVRMRGLDWPDESGMAIFDPPTGYVGAIFPQGDGTARLYLGPAREQRERLSGAKDVDSFLEQLKLLLGERDVFGEAEAIGPLATFDTEMRWVEQPNEDGLALIGDASGYTDPTWGQGLALGFRDARVLGDALLGSGDWRQAATEYAAEHDRYFGAMVNAETWLDELMLAPGPEGDETRARAFSAWADDSTRNLNATRDGPDFVADEEARRRFFGLDLVGEQVTGSCGLRRNR